MVTEIRKRELFIFNLWFYIFTHQKLITQQKLRSWNGVFLSKRFLESEKNARFIVLDMMRLYEEFQCEILVEVSGMRTENDVN